MFRHEFEAFWVVPKSLVEDIHFRAQKGHNDIYIFGGVELIGDLCAGILLNGDFNCRTGSLSLNFTLAGVGAIHRYCLGGPSHKDAGRYHEHFLQQPSDPRVNLPYAVRRDDLVNLNSTAAWRKICEEANIAHAGTFHEPEGYCR